MPCPIVFYDVGNNSSVAIDRVVRRNLFSGISKVFDDFIETVQHRGMDDNRIDLGPLRPRIEVR